MAGTYVNSSNNAAFPTTGSALSLSITPTAVNNVLIVSAFAFTTLPTMAISDTSGITWRTAFPLTIGGTSLLQSWYGYTVGTTATTITVTFSSGNFSLELVADQFSGLGLGGALDQSMYASASASSSPFSMGPLTPTTNGQMLYAVGNCGSFTGNGPSYNLAQSFDITTSEYQNLVTGSGVPQFARFSTNSGGELANAMFFSFKQPGPTIGTVPGGTALTKPAFAAKFLFFDTGDYSTGL